MTDAGALRPLYVVLRNFLVWRKLLLPSLLGNLADPLIWLVGLGFGLGALLPQVDGVSYLAFLGSGMLCYSTMYSASFEALYSAFARLQIQRTWEGILHAPMKVRDVVIGEWLWAGLKALLSGAAILLVMYLLGVVEGFAPLGAIGVVLLVGLTFSAVALVITALAKSYDFFVYYFTLVMTPMMLISGVFFPTSALPEPVRIAAEFLPLAHATELARGFVLERPLERPLLNVFVLVAYTAAGLALAIRLARRRLAR